MDRGFPAAPDSYRNARSALTSLPRAPQSAQRSRAAFALNSEPDRPMHLSAAIQATGYLLSEPLLLMNTSLPVPVLFAPAN